MELTSFAETANRHLAKLLAANAMIKEQQTQIAGLSNEGETSNEQILNCLMIYTTLTTKG